MESVNPKVLFLLVLLSGVTARSVASADEQVERGLSELELMKLTELKNPAQDRIEAALLASDVNRSRFLEKFSPSFFASGSYSKTNEQGLITFAPIFTPIQQYKVGVRKSFVSGVSSEFSITTTQQTAESVGLTSATTVLGSLSVSVDLWKDVAGHTSKAQENAFSADLGRTMLQKKINTKAHQIAVRKLYWLLVANNESRKLNASLLQTAEAQTKDVKRRQANSVADRGDVARSESQVASRRASLTLLEFQKDSIIRELREAIPSLMGREIQLAPYSIDETVDQVLACTALIGTHSKAPLENTLYDDLISQIETKRTEQTTALDRLGDVDLKFVGRLQAKGIDNTSPGTYGAAFSDITGNNRWGYQVGLELSIPLDSAASDSERLQKLHNDRISDAEVGQLNSRLHGMHKQILTSMFHLKAVIDAQKLNSKHLSVRLKSVERKFSQARISVTDLIADQDASFNADLAVIDTQIQVLDVLLNYLMIFTETPCAFNLTQG